MKPSIYHRAAAAGLIAALSAVAADAAFLPPSFHDFGQAAADDTNARIIRISSNTRSVGVYRLEKVKFVDAQTGRSFAWNFNTIHAGNFPLADIAPAGVLAGQAVRVYVWDATTADTQP